MAKFNSKLDGHHEYIWPCDCGDSHFIQITWDDQDSEWRFLEITETYHARTLWNRVKTALTVLRRKPHYHSGVVLDEANTKEILETLTQHAATI